MSLDYRALAGIDVHKKMLAVVVRFERQGETSYEQRRFGTTSAEIQHLAAWLQSWTVTEVVMESTAQYWRPVWYGLEPHFRLHLTHPLALRAPRGRKRDFPDAIRLADRLASGDLIESFVPGDQQRRWRSMTRVRVDLKQKVSMVRSQVEGLLEEGSIKLSSVVSDLFGATGWAILERLAAGDSEALVLAQEARGSLRGKKQQLEESLGGKLHPEHRMLLGLYMEQVRVLMQQIQSLSAVIAVSMKEHAADIVRLCRLPGIDTSAAQELLAEIGPGAEQFDSAQQLASWAGVCPGRQESAGVNHSSRSARGNRFLRRIICQIGWAAARTKRTFLSALFQRWSPRLGAKSAAWAIGHRMLKFVWHVLHQKMEYQERGPVQPDPRALTRKLRRIANQLRAAGLDPATLLPKNAV